MKNKKVSFWFRSLLLDSWFENGLLLFVLVLVVGNVITKNYLLAAWQGLWVVYAYWWFKDMAAMKSVTGLSTFRIREMYAERRKLKWFIEKTVKTGETYLLTEESRPVADPQTGEDKPFTLRKGILCLKCMQTSWNENDVQKLYCGNCNMFHKVQIIQTNKSGNEETIKDYKPITYHCEKCGHTEEWSPELYAEKGEPVCPNDDSDMKLKHD